MAQVTYTKLGLKPNFDEIAIIHCGNEQIEVKQFLPLEKKLEVLTSIINNSIDERGFYNTARIDFNIKMEMLYAYTNIKFTDKQKENSMKLYDNFVASGLMKQIWDLIPENDRDWFEKHTNASIVSIMNYRNSVYGILDSLQTDYSNLNLDVDAIKNKLTNDTNIKDLKEIFDKTI